MLQSPAGRRPPAVAEHLRGVKIVLDPGHVGQRERDGFKVGPTGLREAVVNLAVAKYLREFLEAAGATWELVTYGGARHSFTNPGADKVGMAAMAYDARADRHSWDLLQYFLKEIFAQK